MPRKPAGETECRLGARPVTSPLIRVSDPFRGRAISSLKRQGGGRIFLDRWREKAFRRSSGRPREKAFVAESAATLGNKTPTAVGLVYIGRA